MGTGTPKLFLATAAVIYLMSCNTADGQGLTAELCSAKLPIGRVDGSPIYDGDDTIYLFSGWSGFEVAKDVVKYSISKDTVEVAGQLPITDLRGAAVMNKLKNIFYFQAWRSRSLYQYFPANQTFQNVAPFNYNSLGKTVIKPDVDTALIFDNVGITVRSLDLNTLEVKTIGNYSNGDSMYVADAVWMKQQEKAYLFTYDDIVTYDPSGNRFASLGKRLPPDSRRKAVTDGRYIYLFEDLGTKAETGILLFNPQDEEIDYLEVANKPWLNEPAVIYVEKLNRIYTFGGRDDNFAPPLKDIYYINLDPVNQPITTTTIQPPISTVDPDVFNCMGRPDGVYPYPGDCDKFAICRDNHGYEFECPEPLLFHPVNRQCTWPDWVDCSEECKDSQI